jgi:DHA2 family multidrug resistance protein
MRNLGGAVGLAVASNYLSSFTQKNYAALSSNIESTNDLLNQRLYTLKENFELFNYYDPEKSALQYVDSVIQREAYVISFNQVNIYISLLFFISAISVIFIKKAKPEEES